tara:strand:+ start:1760 stop:2512 length:753 start_codon:yes stop_codon:yes gene_type:complete
MDVNGKPKQTSHEEFVYPHITRQDLQKNWIGLGAALDWIAQRGQPISEQMFSARDDDAAEKLVEVLADLPPAIAEALVRGAAEDEEGPLLPIPSGIWWRTATSDANDANQLYRLIGTDYDCEWEGAIHGFRVSGYRRVQIRTDFILENWPEHERNIEPPPARHRVAQAEVRRLIESIVASTPSDLAPLTQREIVDLVRRCIPAAPRDLVRQLCKELRPTSKPGPKGRRNPDRRLRVQELGEKFIAAQLPN